MPFHLVLALLFIVGLGLMGVALSGYGSPDRTDQPPPHMPGHDTERERREREQG